MSSVIYSETDTQQHAIYFFYLVKKKNIANCYAIHVSVLPQIISMNQSKCIYNINPLSPKDDQHPISPYIINPESNIQVTRIEEMIINLIVKQILLISASGDVQRTVWRKCILMLGCKGLTKKWSVCSVTSFTPPFPFFMS